MTNEQKVLKFTGRIVAGAYYNFQEIRKGTMNRVRDIIRKKAEGIDFDEVEEKIKEKKYDAKYADATLMKTLRETKKLFSSKEYAYLMKTLETANKTQALEKQYEKLMLTYIREEKVYEEFLKHIRGIGAVLSANLIKEFGYCEKYEHVSSLWKHCGLHVVNGVAPKKKKGEIIEYNPRLRTMMWKIGDQFIKQKSPFYRDIYDQTKKKQLARKYKMGELKEKFNGYKKEDIHLSKGHAHARAMRKSEKIFLEHYWVCSRELIGLETGKPYVVEHLGHEDYVSYKEALAINKGEDYVKSRQN